MGNAYVHGYHPREIERLQDQAGTLVDLRTYQGVDHFGVRSVSAPDVLAWIADRFAGRPATTTC